MSISEAMLETVFSHAFDGIVAADETGRIEAFNPAAEEIFGYREGEVLGRNVSLLMPRAMGAAHPGYIDSYLHGRDAGKVGRGPRELIARRKNGEMFPIDIAITEARTATGRRFVAIVRDIGERKARDQALQAALEAAQNAAARERKASRAKVNFLSSLTHELRTPLNAILGFSEMMQDERIASRAASCVEYAQLIHTAGAQLLGLVNNLLELARVENPQLVSKQEGLALASFLSDVEAHWRPLVQRQDIAFSAELGPATPAMIRTDVRCLRHVLTNLLGNALKFTDSGGISLRLGLFRNADDGLQLQGEVRDTGIGIDSASAESIFHAFTQLDEGMTRRYDGAGLGLAICRRLCEAAGGTIGVRPNDPGGSVFWFRIPAQEM